MAPFHPDLASAAKWLPRGFGVPWLMKLLRHLPAPPTALPPSVTLEQVQLPKRPGVSVRVFTPLGSGPRPALLWIHGGGYVIGSAKQDDGFCAKAAVSLGATVVSVDYGLAPEHPFPGPLEDCFAAWEWLLEHAAQRELDTGRIAIGGQSAGGGLAAALTHVVLDRARGRPVFQVLVYPMLDDRTVLREPDTDYRVWSPSANRIGWASYLGQAPGSDAVPALAGPARRESLVGLPAAWIGVGTHDLFHHEDVAYAERLRAANVPVELEVIPGAFHGFETLLPNAPISRFFVERQVDALRRAFSS